MHKLMLFSLKHRVLSLLIIIVISSIAIPYALKVRLDVSTRGMMEEGDKDLSFYEETLRRFGTDNISVIYVRDKNLFSPAKLKRLQDLAYELEDLPGVKRVDSIFSVNNFKSSPEGLETGPLVDWLPETKKEADEILHNALNNPIVVKDLVAADGKSLALNLLLGSSRKDRASQIKISENIDKILAKYHSNFDKIFQFGLSYTQRKISENIIADQIELVPLSVIILLLTLMLNIKSPSGAVLPMLTAGISVLWTAGFMGYFGIPLNILTVIVPSLIIVIGSTEDIHIISEFMDENNKLNNKNKAISVLANKIGVAILLTSITTFLGFFSITLNKITLLKQFGWVSSFGLFVNPLITCILSPIYLYYFPPKLARRQKKESVFKIIEKKLIHFVLNNKKALLWGAVALSTLLFIFIPKIKVNNDLLGYFKSNSDIVKRSKILHRDLSGAQVFFLRITSGEKGTFKKVKFLKQVDVVEKILKDMKAFDNVLSFVDYLKFINREMNNGKKEFFKLPDKDNLVSQYILLLHRDDISRYVTSDFSEVNIVVRHNISSSYILNRDLNILKKKIEKVLDPHLHFKITGEGILINKAADSMAKGQVQSISFILVVVFLLMSLLFVNFKAGIISLVPNIVPIVWIFGFMGMFDIPLNVGTTMIAAISIGIAIDDTIHLMSRYNKELRNVQDQALAIDLCLQSEIRPVIATSVALALGFAILGFSNFLPVVYFGLLSALVMFFAVVCDLLLTPSVLTSTQLITLWDLIKQQVSGEVLRRCPLFMGLKKWQVKRLILLGRLLEFLPREYIIKQEDYGDSMFILLQGEAEVWTKGQNKRVLLAKLKEGDIFGEMALVNPGPRSADVIASTEAKVLELNLKSFKRIQLVSPRLAAKVYLNLAKVLGVRLKDMDRRMVEDNI
ncbi:MMPL family transporter [Desulfonauticus submarinus]